MFSLDQILASELTLASVPGTSKKKVFETASEFIAGKRPALQASEVYNNLLARERLGSTALGDGIAIPHCRLSNCDEAIVVLMTLDAPVDFDAADGKPVDILFMLLVPEEATQEHLDILAGLAGLLDNSDFRDSLRDARTNEELYRNAVSFAQ